MMSGVPAAAISPMKAMLEPIAIMFRVVMKNGESSREDDEEEDVEDEQQDHARLGTAEEGEERTAALTGDGSGTIGCGRHGASPFMRR